MASTSLSLSFALAANCTLTTHKQNPSFSLSSNLSFLSRLPSSHKLSFQSIFSPRLPFQSLPKSAESEVAVPEAAEVVQDTPAQVPKREEIFAVVMIGSRQYIVFPGRFIYTRGSRLLMSMIRHNQRLVYGTLVQITLNKVLLVGTRTTTYIGKPVVTNAVVHATIEEQGLDDKVIVFKYKKKKKYRRNIGHRQPNTRIRINSITGYEDYSAVTLDSLSKAQ
ncbi:hypothetical protein L6164_007289 [Bauhinia variegata]|uniref:Uncharacterized protein n=1 Tax=Bauhinia variegata TaxID=167791 RepID=A0ACB9PDE1_BAUVA|nr:hypothetical protein L6164_007289 [Bauhinia variegata]